MSEPPIRIQKMHVRRKKLVANRSRSGADRFSAAITSE